MDARGTPETAAKPSAKRVTHWWPLVSGIAALVLTFGLGALIVLRDHGLPLSIDTWWMEVLNEHRAPV